MSRQWINTLSASLIILNSYSVYADITTQGFQEIRSQQLESITHSGKLKLEKVTISGSTTVNGSLKAKESTLNDLTIMGSAELDNIVVNGVSQVHGKISIEDSVFKKPLLVKGQIKAEDSVFEQTITLQSNHSKFENCQLSDLVLETNNDQKEQHLFLEETQVKGNVTIKGRGVVHMDKKSKIDGQITGGKVETH